MEENNLNFNLTKPQKRFIKDYVKSIKNGNAAIFAGAGLSMQSGTLSWSDLFKDVADELDLTNDHSTDMPTLAQYYENYTNSRVEISELIMNSFSNYISPNENQKLVAELPIDTVWTTNYDTLLEEAYKKEYKATLVKRSPEDFSLNGQKKDVVIYKMHGDVTQPTRAIITKNDYETYNNTHLVYTTALKGDLVEKKFLFIGFSFEDPNLNYVLARIRALIGENKPNHYFFIKKVQEEISESKEDFELRKTKQELKMKDLIRYGINPVEINDYNEITGILKIINRLSKRNTIFISGAKSDYQYISKELSNKLLTTLTKKLIKENNKIISGYGLDVGSTIIDTALETISENPMMKLDDCLKLYPFPQAKDANWTAYRKQMLDNSGIAIFLFGNKIKNGVRIKSNGMIEEFEIAHELGIKVIPIGCTGVENVDATKEIYDKVINSYEKFYGSNKKVIEQMKKLGNHNILDENDIQEVSDIVISIVKELQIIR